MNVSDVDKSQSTWCRGDLPQTARMSHDLVRVAILSDLHLEGSGGTIPDPAADVVVLAGDIDDGQRGIEWANVAFECPVIYVLGNHEYRGSSIPARLAQCKAAAAPHVHVLEQECATICGVRFCGATLWSDCSLFGPQKQREHQALAAEHCADFRLICTDQGARISPAEVADIHTRTRRWIESQLESADASTVMVTHHAPSPRSLPSRLLSTPIVATYATDLHELIGRVPLWVHGHIHDCSDYEIDGTRVICNPNGRGAKAGSTSDQSNGPWVVVWIRGVGANNAGRVLQQKGSC